MSAHVNTRLTEEQYLEIERAAETRSEFYDGRMYAMSGASYRHVIIASNLHYRLRGGLEGKACVAASADLRVHTGELFTYPDVVVTCGPPRFLRGMSDTLTNPTVLIEVMSPSTESYDRGFKAAQYRRIESLKEYAFVSQKEARVEVYTRQADGRWVLTERTSLDEACPFVSLDCEIPLRQIYEQVQFDENPVSFPPADVSR